MLVPLMVRADFYNRDIRQKYEEVLIMIEAIIGDAVCSRFEFNNYRDIHFKLINKG